MKNKIIVCLLFLLIHVGSVGQVAPRVTGFFSDMHYIQEAGDVVGTEVWLVFARGGYWATVQMAEGEPEPPVVVPVQVAGSKITFSIAQKRFLPNGTPATDLVLKFDGTVTKDALLLTLGTDHEVLARRSSYWQ